MGKIEEKPLICKDCPTFSECEGSNQEDCARGILTELKREIIFNIVTDPPCHYCEVGVGRKVCEYWDVQGHCCYLKDIHEGTGKCPLVKKIVEAHEVVVRGILEDLRGYVHNENDEEGRITATWQGIMEYFEQKYLGGK